MEKIQTIGEKMTFWKLLNDNKIIIPKIQRDFAQGREDVKIEIIRTEILNKLFDVLDKDNQVLNLDFVYGSNDNNELIPLDGQQRLTTLFLLHWYLARISNNYTEECKEILLKFKYEIRSSTQKFITAILTKEISYEVENLSIEIENQSWFFYSWKKDPTVKAMLVMVNAIHNLFKGKTEFWEKLRTREDITFYFLPLNEFKLTDELYVKMNSRGKQLSDFENFKAWLDDELEKKTTKEFKKDWSYKLDTTWTDLFWNSDNGDNSIDEEMMNFFRGIAFFNYVENFKGNIKSEEFKLKTTVFNDVNIYISNKEYQTFLFDFKDIKDDIIIQNITTFLDFYSKEEVALKINELLKEVNFWDSEKEDNSNLFMRFLSKTDFKSRTLFYGLFQYVLSNNKDIEEIEFKKKIRILRNLVENTDINTENIKNVLSSVNRLMRLDDVINEIASIELTGFYGNQITEEKLKAILINIGDYDWKSQICKIEVDSFLKGKIDFLLEFSKINEVYDFEKFKKVSNSFLLIFKIKDDLLRRALLTIGDYSSWDGYTYSLSAHRYSLLNSASEWKTAFDNKDNKFIRPVYNLLDMITVNQERNEFLNSLINKELAFSDWRNKIIKDKKLLSECYHKRICLNEEKSVLFMLEKTRVVGENFRKLNLKKSLKEEEIN
ncbi:hypothetical protein HNP99_003335 [Flavobacterium sp. 28A]|uniref:DUF262 domain-containing protein n=1 Tax=Flavobacterium sp. 28A TaxID=2735895 RepID=UPI00156DA14A|nr:DUF262 domain-containing protein [Flavobacterium sp. 28A]NRT16961.1 hypothetical protein [Flavobacterium sp. 28A]